VWERRLCEQKIEVRERMEIVNFEVNIKKYFERLETMLFEMQKLPFRVE
jgi:hypothetical protein